MLYERPPIYTLRSYQIELSEPMNTNPSRNHHQHSDIRETPRELDERMQTSLVGAATISHEKMTDNGWGGDISLFTTMKRKREYLSFQ